MVANWSSFFRSLSCAVEEEEVVEGVDLASFVVLLSSIIKLREQRVPSLWVSLTNYRRNEGVIKRRRNKAKERRCVRYL
jgi:hypothetical protein